MTDKTKGNKGISAFIVDKDDPGFSIGKIEHKMGCLLYTSLPVRTAVMMLLPRLLSYSAW